MSREELTAWPHMEGFACLEAEKHQEEQHGGCTCGFCAWSVEHVVVMTVREVLEEVRRYIHSPIDLSGLTPGEETP